MTLTGEPGAIVPRISLKLLRSTVALPPLAPPGEIRTVYVPLACKVSESRKSVLPQVEAEPRVVLSGLSTLTVRAKHPG